MWYRLKSEVLEILAARNCNHSIKLNSSPAISTDRSSLRCLARMALNLVSELLEKQMLFLTLFIWNKAKRPKILSEILQLSIKSKCPAYLDSILTLSEKEKWYKSWLWGGNLSKVINIYHLGTNIHHLGLNKVQLRAFWKGTVQLLYHFLFIYFFPWEWGIIL